MTRDKLAAAVAERTGLTKRDASAAVFATFDVIAGILGEGGDVAVTNFGTFRRVEVAPRTGVDPRSGESVPIEGGAYVRFRVSKRLVREMRSGNDVTIARVPKGTAR